MKPVLDLARTLDIATNPDPTARFEAGSGGFQVWCTPQDRPKGWNGIEMNRGAFSKPCEYVGSVIWSLNEEKIIALGIETTAYALAEQKPDEYCNLIDIPQGSQRHTIFNRADDIEWLKEKVTWLFQTAGVPLMDFEWEPPAPVALAPYLLAHYVSDQDDYVMILTPGIDPQEFCQPGYKVARRLEIGDAEEFPTDVILRPDRDFQELEIEPDEGPLVEQYENASRLGDDRWLEAAYEDQISGWGE
jgi:hypothetical protein